MKFFIGLTTTKGKKAVSVELDEGEYLTGVSVATESGDLLMMFPFQLDGSGMYVRWAPWSLSDERNGG